eukprot:NODE_123_length_17687_cov_0.732261.p2 type:complete len:651 gc:universal NODE_123_length_17687_cov_0.732261:4712-2760(-)
MNLQKGSIVLDYIVEDKIGKGSFATVYKVSERKNSSAFYALKAVDVTSMNRKMLVNLDQEIAIHKKLMHHNIVKLIASEKTPFSYNIILEYCLTDLGYFIKRKTFPISAMDLPSIMYQHNNGLDPVIVKLILAQISSALAFCHQFNIIHRDLKPQNILIHPFVSVLDDYPILEQEILLVNYRKIDFKYLPMAKIADFGFAAILDNKLAETICGSPLYMAPEVLKYEQYDYKVDLWSLGVILYECFIGKVPFMANNHLELLKIINQTPNVNYADIPLDIQELLRHLLQVDPKYRIDFDHFIGHAVVKQCQSIIPINMDEQPKVRQRVYHRRTSSATSSFSKSKERLSPLKNAEPIQFNSSFNRIYLNSPPTFKSSSLQNYLSRKQSLSELTNTGLSTSITDKIQDDFVILEKSSYENKPLKRLSGLNLSYSPTSQIQSPVQANFDTDLSVRLTESDLLLQAEDCLNYAKKNCIGLSDDIQPTVNHIMEELERKIDRLMTIYQLFVIQANTAILFRVGCLICTMILQDISYIQKSILAARKHLRKLQSWHLAFLSQVYEKLNDLHHSDFDEVHYIKQYTNFLFLKSIDYLKAQEYKQSLNILESMLLYPDPMSVLLHAEVSNKIKLFFKSYETNIIDVMTIINKKLQQLQKI